MEVHFLEYKAVSTRLHPMRFIIKRCLLGPPVFIPGPVCAAQNVGPGRPNRLPSPSCYATEYMLYGTRPTTAPVKSGEIMTSSWYKYCRWKNSGRSKQEGWRCLHNTFSSAFPGFKNVDCPTKMYKTVIRVSIKHSNNLMF